MSENARKFVNNGIDLVTLPDVYLRVKAVLEDPNSSAAEMAAAIETDPATTARLLRLANSSFFGFAAQVAAVPRAVSLLGTVHVHDLVLATSIAANFGEVESSALDMPTFWRHSLARAIAAKLLANHCNVLDGDRLFVAGLLSHIGEMLLALHDPAMAERAASSAENRCLSLAVVQTEMFGFDYAELGAELINAWQLPALLEETVRFQQEPTSAPNFELETSLVHVAGQLALSPQSNPADGIDLEVLKRIELSEEQLGTIKNELDTEVGTVTALLFPEKRAA